MSTREYIGARYVPIFGRKDEDTIAWDNTAAYEPLTIVLYQGNSYTSRQYVPGGIEINNEEYWALTGNYNAQVEAYRQEVVEYADDVEEMSTELDDVNAALPISYFSADNTVKEYIDNKTSDIPLKVHQLSGYGDIGSCYIIEYDGIFVCNDAGGTEGSVPIRNFMQNVLGNNKLTALIVSHFHADHAYCVDVVKDFCDDNTEVFMQMEPTSENDQISTYTQYRERLLTYFPNAQVPVNNSVHTYGDLNVRIFNADINNRVTYDNTPANTSEIPLNSASGLNNYSLICEYKCKAGSFLYTSDVEGVAQKLNADYVKPVDLFHNPHHVSNITGFLKFFTNAKTDKYETTIGTDSINVIIRRYTGAIMRYMGATLYSSYNSLQGYFTYKINNGHVETNAANVYTFDSNVFSSYSYSLILSATYYNDDPWAVFRMSAQNLYETFRDYAIPGEYMMHSTPDSAESYFFFNTFKDELSAIGCNNDGSHITTDAYLIFSVKKGLFELSRFNSQQYSNMVKIVCVTSSTANWNNYIEYNHITDVIPVSTLQEPATSFVISDARYQRIAKSANVIQVQLTDSGGSNLVSVPCVRSGAAANHGRNLYSGVAVSGNYIYVTGIDSSFTVRGSRRPFSDLTTPEALYIGNISFN